MATTIYDVQVRYGIEDRGTKAVTTIANRAERASRSLGGVSLGLGRIATLAASGFGMHLAFRSLIGYNDQLQQARTTISGLLQMNMGGTFADNQVKANKLLVQFREDAKQSAGTMQDLVDFSGLVVGPITRMGGGLSEIRDISRGASIAAKALGIEAEVAARDIQQALAGTAGQKDQFFRAIMEPLGMTTIEWNKMVKETPQKATAALVAAFTQPAIMDMAKTYETSWAGVTSTLKDNLEQTLGAIGLPLMQAITDEVIKLNHWFEKNEATVKIFVKEFSAGLVEGFRIVKQVAGFLVEHKDLLFMLAKAFLVGKATKFAAELFHGVGSGVTEFVKAIGGATGGLRGMVNAMGPGGVITALGALAAGAQFAADALLEHQEQTLAATGEQAPQLLIEQLVGAQKGQFKHLPESAKFGGFQSQFHSLAPSMMREALASGFITKGGKIGREAVERATDTSEEREQVIRGLERLLEVNAQLQEMQAVRTFDRMADVGTKMADVIDQRMQRTNETLGQVAWSMFVQARNRMGMRPTTVEPPPDRKSPPNNVNVTVRKIEVVSDDPDRIAFGLIGAFNDIQNNPTQTRRIVPGGRET